MTQRLLSLEKPRFPPRPGGRQRRRRREGARPWAALGRGREQLEAGAGAPLRSGEEGGGEPAGGAGPRGTGAGGKEGPLLALADHLSPRSRAGRGFRGSGWVLGPEPGTCVQSARGRWRLTFVLLCAHVPVCPQASGPSLAQASGRERSGKEKERGRTRGPAAPHSRPLGDAGWGTGRLRGWGTRGHTEVCEERQLPVPKSCALCKPGSSREEEASGYRRSDLKSKLHSCGHFSIIVGFCNSKPTFARSKKMTAFPRAAPGPLTAQLVTMAPKAPLPHRTLAPAPPTISHPVYVPPTLHQPHRLYCYSSVRAGSSLPQDLYTCCSVYLECLSPRASVPTASAPSLHCVNSDFRF